MKFAISRKMIQKIILGVLLTVSTSLFSQTLEEIRFNEVVHDFGRKKE